MGKILGVALFVLASGCSSAAIWSPVAPPPVTRPSTVLASAPVQAVAEIPPVTSSPTPISTPPQDSQPPSSPPLFGQAPGQPNQPPGEGLICPAGLVPVLRETIVCEAPVPEVVCPVGTHIILTDELMCVHD